MKYCCSVTLRPRTMDELTKLTSMLLVHNLHRFPAMNCLRLELLVSVRGVTKLNLPRTWTIGSNI